MADLRNIADVEIAKAKQLSYQLVVTNRSLLAEIEIKSEVNFIQIG